MSATKVAAVPRADEASALSAEMSSPRAVIEIHARIEDAEAAWRQLEAQCLASPYQGFDWQRAYAMHALRPRESVRVAIVRDAPSRRAVLLLPLVLRWRGAMLIASTVGGKHANFHMPLFCAQAGPHLAPEAVRGHLTEIARRLRIDAYDFQSLPATWRGQPNPLVLPAARPSPSDAYWTSLADRPDGAPAVALSADTRKKLRKKARWLEEIGAVGFARAETPEDARETLEAFFALKTKRMRDLGIEDPFACERARAFLEAATRPDGEMPAPVLLWSLRAGERIVATFGAACDGRRASGMITAFDTRPDIARCSPGDLLMMRVVEALRADGYESFDLGVGEARYKSQFCDALEQLYDVALPVSVAGRGYARLARSATRLKRWAKTTPVVAAAIRRGRRLAAPVTRLL
ncbi:GNAT family N-acetyltransferase [Salinarimonas sp.]|uniref:GNAT family N-acetyltransferase n=1 Tax=Salinarimonas sp. TaxID=2766526 RepID=UPI0032D8ED64